MYRDSQLGICIDLSGPDGNVFHLFAAGRSFDKQLEREHRYKQHLEFLNDYLKSIGYEYTPYQLALELFEFYYPFVTLLNNPFKEAEYAAIS